MGITNLEIFTYEKFYKILDHYAVDQFTERCNKLPFSPNFVVTWDNPHNENISRQINEWYNEEYFMGYVNKYWSCQMEFEREEDVVAFKLRWM